MNLLRAGNVTITGQATGVNSISYDVGTCSVSVSYHPIIPPPTKPCNDRHLATYQGL